MASCPWYVLVAPGACCLMSFHPGGLSIITSRRGDEMAPGSFVMNSKSGIRDMSEGVYISGTGPAAGKSVVVIGVMELLARHGRKIGFFRPVVEKTVILAIS